jgi:lipopolysaccharide export system protein LptA
MVTISGFGQGRPGRVPGTPQRPQKTIQTDETQTQPTPPPRRVVPEDTTKIPVDSLQAPKKKGDITTTINYSARDSINTSVDGQIVWLYGNAKIVYGEIELEADEIEIDYKNNTLKATGTRDSTGRRVGYPVFKNGIEEYETRDIMYNFKTGRARITEVVTKQGEGFLHGDVVFKNEKSELLSLRNTYTTCSLEDPHFRIRSTKTKAIPDDKIVSGPFYMEFNDIPMPIGFLFGMFPAQRESKSGIIMPSYGEENRRGFNLRGGGYYFDVSEYFKLALTGDIFSKGGHAIYVQAPYVKRYAFNGNFNFSYSNNKVNQFIEDKSEQKDFSLAWTHSPQSKGTGRFSASVNAATSTYNQNNNLNFAYRNPASSSLNSISRKLSSNISYSKRFANTPFTMGLNLNHNQDLQTEQVDLQLPNLTLNMQNQYPFQRKDGRPTKLDNFSIGYSMTAGNRITNNLGRIEGSNPARDSITPFNFNNFASLFENGKKGIRHSMPIGYSFKALKYLTVSPSINYEEKWYFEKLSWEYDIINNRPTLVASDTIKEFNRIANYSFSTGINTRLYGTYFFNQGKVKAIRHIINPNISFSYTPDFTKNDNYFQAIRENGKTIYKSRHEGFVYGSSNTGKSGAIGFGIGNSVEMKVKSEKDTVARKVSLLNSLSFSSSYNLVADSFKLAPIGISANNTVLGDLLNINLSASLDPYYYKTFLTEEGKTFQRRVDEYAWKGGKLGRITSATLAMNSNLNPKARANEQSTREKITGSDLPEQEKNYLLNDPSAYIDFEIPWSLRVGYNLNYSHPINQDPQVTQTLQFSGDLSLSKSWKITFNSGYHFETEKFTQTTITVARDLHCWTMNLSWVPFGYFTSYNFSIRVKASVLQDLKMERRKPFFDNL